jgi:hypothetical protein
MAAPAVRHERDDACLGQAAGRRFDLDQLSLRRRVRREVADIEHRPEQIVRRPEAIPTTTQVCESLRLRKVERRRVGGLCAGHLMIAGANANTNNLLANSEIRSCEGNPSAVFASIVTTS